MGQNLISIGTPKVEVKNKICDFFYDAWCSDFHEYEGTRMGKIFYNGPDKLKAKHIFKLSRVQLGRFVRIISGHNALFYFQSKVDNNVSALCRFCEEADETFFHLLTECPRFLCDRNDILQDEIITNDHFWSIRKLLDFSLLPGINDALEGPQWTSPDFTAPVGDIDEHNSNSSTETEDGSVVGERTGEG